MPAVPNQIPLSPTTPRIAIIGSCPSSTDEAEQKLFIGGGGQMLRKLLSQIGVSADDCFLGCVSNIKLTESYINKHWETDVIKLGVATLAAQLKQFQPDVILCLGASAVRALNGGIEISSIHTYRGSPFKSPLVDAHCVATFDPSFLIRAHEQLYLFLFDVKKAIRIGSTPNFRLPNRRIRYAPSAGECIEFLAKLRADRLVVAFDLEGGVEGAGIKCVSFCNDPLDIITIPFRDGANFINGNYFADPEDEVRVWRAVCELLTDPAVPKLAHNNYYELFCFMWNHAIVIANMAHDTMFMHWELLCETDKDLGTVASIYTDEPYYKSDRKIDDDVTHRIYCAKDSAVTLEAYYQMLPMLQAHQPSYDHYLFNMRCVYPYLYMAMRGCKVSQPEWKKQVQETYVAIIDQQEKLNAAVGAHINPKSNAQKLAWLYGHVGDPPKNITDSFRHTCYLATISPKFKPQKKRTPEGQRLTADETALDKIYIDTGDKRMLELLRLIQLRTRFSDLQKVIPFPDGRIRCNFTNVGPDTGRSASKETWVTTQQNKATVAYDKTNKVTAKVKPAEFQLGTNLQNQTKEVRKMFVSDPGYDFFQYDLAGADAWTVAADLMAQGAPQMFEHISAGIKPSKNIVLALRYGLDVVANWQTADWKKHQHEVDGEDITYRMSKGIQHGTNYGMEVPLLRALILKNSIKDMLATGQGEPTILNNSMGIKLQNLYIRLYDVNKRRLYLNSQLAATGRLDSANGHRRKFLKIRDRRRIEGEVMRQALAHEPQANTTFVTNIALCNMYYDPHNRRVNGSVRVEPILSVHDAVCGQWLSADRSWALSKLKEWFDIPLVIHGIDVAIPADGGWGTSWKDLPNEI